MAILPYLNANDVPEDYRDLLARGISMPRIVMHSLEGGKTFLSFGDWIRFKSKLDPRLRQMIILQVGYLLQNDYEVSHHVKISRDFGVTGDDMAAIMQETKAGTSSLPAVDRLALRVAREMAKERKLSADTTRELVRSFSPELVVEIVMIAGFYTFVALVVDTLGVDVEDFYEPYLKDMPYPA
jgi:alkylhydroperoxidase family enzyme